MVDEFAKSRQETMFVTYHEGHEEHEAEIIKYFLTLRVLRALRGENQTFYGFIIFDESIKSRHSQQSTKDKRRNGHQFPCGLCG
jgi:hypothetical protein